MSEFQRYAQAAVLVDGLFLTQESSVTVQRATNAAFTTGFASSSVAANATTLNVTVLNRATTYYFRIRANNGITSSAWVNAAPFPIVTNP